jgi:salicylate hydroxylase/6-hydroxynicotinate 3-monooxygenase
MSKSTFHVAIAGAGMGGLAAAAALRKQGLSVTVYEQARQFTRLGAGIQIGCNAMHVLRGLGLEAVLRAETFYPRSWNNRHWKTGEVLFDMVFGASAEAKYGAPYLLAHRGDLHEALASIVPPECLRLDHRLVGVDHMGSGVRLSFANGHTAEADLLIGADGVNSIVRSTLFDESEPRFAGRIAYRTTYPARLLDGFDMGDCTKWWGEDRHIVMYPVKSDRSEVYFVISQPDPSSATSHGRRATSRCCARRSRASIPTCSGCSPPARRSTSGCWSITNRSSAGSTATSCCWATPAIR